MKKNCNGCKALRLVSGSRTNEMVCDLNYKMAEAKRIFGIVVEYKPLESCPKPKTNSQLIFESSLLP